MVLNRLDLDLLVLLKVGQHSLRHGGSESDSAVLKFARMNRGVGFNKREKFAVGGVGFEEDLCFLTADALFDDFVQHRRRRGRFWR